jgi:hypothetical protein
MHHWPYVVGVALALLTTRAPTMSAAARATPSPCLTSPGTPAVTTPPALKTRSGDAQIVLFVENTVLG